MNLVALRRCSASVLERSLFFSKKGGCHHSSRHFSSRPNYYSLAIARDIPSSFMNAVTEFATSEEPINVQRAQEQKKEYLTTLRRYVPTLCLPSLEEYPDSVFVEDTVVAIGGRAMITNPGHPTRRGEVDTIFDILNRLGYDIVDMRRQGDLAYCDGGDVLYTGRHLFVGLSDRTTPTAVDMFTDCFPTVNVRPVQFEGDALHLKSIVTHLDEMTLLAPTGDFGDQVLEEMKVKELGYDIIRLPSMLACNVVSVNGGIVAQHTGCEESKRRLIASTKDRDLTLEFVDMSEIAKADGALTCCSVLLQI